MSSAMNAVFEAIVNCSKPIKAKQLLLTTTFKNLRNRVLLSDDAETLFDLAVRWVRCKNQEDLWLVNHGAELFSIVAKAHPKIIEAKFCSELGRELLQEEERDGRASDIVRWAVDALSETKQSFVINLFPEVVRLLQRLGVRDQSFDLLMCLPLFPPENDTELARTLVSLLANTRVSSNKLPQDTKVSVDKIVRVCENWWRSDPILADKRQLLLMQALYDVMASAQVFGSEAPSPVLASLLAVLEEVHVIAGLKKLPLTLVFSATQQLSQWLVEWPYCLNTLHPLVLVCLQRLAQEGQLDELTSIAVSISPKLVKIVWIPALRSVAPLLWFLLISSHGSREPLQQILPHIGNAVQRLKAENSSSSQECLFKLTGLCSKLSQIHSQHKEEMEAILKGLPVPTEEELAHLLQSESWMSTMAVTCPEMSSHTQGPRGLNNLGNTCYMNSVLQTLFMTPSFRMRVLQCSPDPSKQSLMVQLQQLFVLMSFSLRPALSPSTEFLAVARPQSFLWGHQEDCSEFLGHLLCLLHDQEKTLQALPLPNPSSVPKPPPSSPESPHSGLSLKRWTTEEDLSDSGSVTALSCKRKARSLAAFDETSAESNKNNPNPPVAPCPPLTDVYSDSTDSGIQSVGSAEDEEEEKEPESLVHRVFGGQLITFYSCHKCEGGSRSLDAFLELQLALPPGEENPGVDDLIKYFLAPETLSGENQYHCEHCKHLQDATRTLVIARPPEHLILTLKRFGYDQELKRRSKLMCPVQIPDLLSLPTSKGEQQYKLYAVILHTGSSPDSGHYHTQAEPPGCDQSWVWLNDEMVSPANNREYSKSDTPYVLLYRQADLVESAEFSFDALPLPLQALVQRDNQAYKKSQKNFFASTNRKNSSNQPPPPPPSSGGCGDNIGPSVSQFIC